MKLLAACQTLETLEAFERNRQAESNKRKVTKSVYSDTSPPSSFFHNRIHTNCNALAANASSSLYSCPAYVEVSTGKAERSMTKNRSLGLRAARNRRRPAMDDRG